VASGPRRLHIGVLCETIHRQQGEVGVRRILGVLSLAKKYGTAAVDGLCRRTRNGRSGIPFFQLLGSAIDEIAILHPLAD